MYQNGQLYKIFIIFLKLEHFLRQIQRTWRLIDVWNFSFLCLLTDWLRNLLDFHIIKNEFLETISFNTQYATTCDDYSRTEESYEILECNVCMPNILSRNFLKEEEWIFHHLIVKNDWLWNILQLRHWYFIVELLLLCVHMTSRTKKWLFHFNDIIFDCGIIIEDQW